MMPPVQSRVTAPFLNMQFLLPPGWRSCVVSLIKELECLMSWDEIRDKQFQKAIVDPELQARPEEASSKRPLQLYAGKVVLRV